MHVCRVGVVLVAKHYRHGWTRFHLAWLVLCRIMNMKNVCNCAEITINAKDLNRIVAYSMKNSLVAKDDGLWVKQESRMIEKGNGHALWL